MCGSVALLCHTARGRISFSAHSHSHRVCYLIYVRRLLNDYNYIIHRSPPAKMARTHALRAAVRYRGELIWKYPVRRTNRFLRRRRPSLIANDKNRLSRHDECVFMFIESIKVVHRERQTEREERLAHNRWMKVKVKQSNRDFVIHSALEFTFMSPPFGSSFY